MKPLILINSRDADFYLLLNHILEVDGFTTMLADGIEETVNLAAEKEPESIVLDCRPGSFSGADACARLKQDAEICHIPVVALISPGAERQQVELLKSGVDESFVRPVAPAKLLDFLRARLAKNKPGPNRANGDSQSLTFGDIEMNLDTYRVRRNGAEVHLGPIEFRLLRYLLQHPEQVFSREELIGAAWPENIYVGLRTVDVHIGRLRKTLKSVAETDVIRTVRSAGYALSEQASA